MILGSLSVLILLSSFVLMANKHIKSYVKTFRAQSLLIACATGIMGVESLLKDSRVDVLVVCVLIIALKVIYIPKLLNKTHAHTHYKVEKDFILNIPLLVIICFALVVFSYFILSSLGESHVQLANSVSVIWIGLFFMISRRKAIGQIIGFLVIENGLFISALLITEGMPFIVDMGILVDLLTAAMIMGFMVNRIDEEFESVDTDRLNNLKG
ncbi:MAG: hydrogenase [Peptococcaceae bacterium]|jgi:hydrogenase-4 component E|nr:hydrogenase [Peptococcaceae bacterium]